MHSEKRLILLAVLFIGIAGFFATLDKPSITGKVYASQESQCSCDYISKDLPLAEAEEKARNECPEIKDKFYCERARIDAVPCKWVCY